MAWPSWRGMAVWGMARVMATMNATNCSCGFNQLVANATSLRLFRVSVLLNLLLH